MARFTSTVQVPLLTIVIVVIVAVGCSQQQPYSDTTAGSTARLEAPGALPVDAPTAGRAADAAAELESVQTVSFNQPLDSALDEGTLAMQERRGPAAASLSDRPQAKSPQSKSPQGTASPVTPSAPAGASGSTSKASVNDADEKLFVGWPKPAVALVFTGRQWGFLEPCGCSGLENQKGGLARRFSLLRQLRAQGWPVVPIDAGNQVRRFGRQAEIKFSRTIDGLTQMQYRAIAFGPDDLRLPGPELVVVVAPKDDQPSPFVCANATIIDPSFTSPFLIIEEGGKKIGVTAVVGERNQQMVPKGDVTFRNASDALQDVWPSLAQARCDLYVLIAHATIEESVALAQQFPQFPLIVSTGGAGEPTIEPDPIEGTKSQLIQIGTKGMYACVVGLFNEPAKPLRYQRVPLDARFPDTDEVLQILAAYQDQLKAEGFEGLGVRPQPHPGNRKFVGSAACADCHGNAWKVWKEGLPGAPAKHAHAFATLEHPPGRANIPRQFDPECLSCHVVGWNPQKYLPYESGFIDLDTTPELIDVGCENCHGPGKNHVDAENGDIEVDDAMTDRLRQEMVLTLEDAEQKCLECHDLDNSPGFQEEGAFERYWAKIKHSKTSSAKKPARQ